nr:Ac1078 [Rattus norvegicus]|eukprot:XP_006244707.1 PREDICTED: uncharacterized protein LOC102548541 [Rattus norvegicus]
MWYIYTMEYYSAIKNNGFMKFVGKWLELENIILSELTQTQKDIHGKWMELENIILSEETQTQKDMHVETLQGQSYSLLHSAQVLVITNLLHNHLHLCAVFTFAIAMAVITLFRSTLLLGGRLVLTLYRKLNICRVCPCYRAKEQRSEIRRFVFYATWHMSSSPLPTPQQFTNQPVMRDVSLNTSAAGERTCDSGILGSAQSQALAFY